MSNNRLKIDYFNKIINDKEKQNAVNAFSDDNWSVIRSKPPNKMNKNDESYGVPTNEKTLQRGIQAHEHVNEEVRQLCEIIRSSGKVNGRDGSVEIEFRLLFAIYVKISNKLVGLLLRARKHGYVDFQGEILFQGRDDHVLIKLLK